MCPFRRAGHLVRRGGFTYTFGPVIELGSLMLPTRE